MKLIARLRRGGWCATMVAAVVAISLALSNAQAASAPATSTKGNKGPAVSAETASIEAALMQPPTELTPGSKVWGNRVEKELEDGQFVFFQYQAKAKGNVQFIPPSAVTSSTSGGSGDGARSGGIALPGKKKLVIKMPAGSDQGRGSGAPKKIEEGVILILSSDKLGEPVKYAKVVSLAASSGDGARGDGTGEDVSVDVEDAEDPFEEVELMHYTGDREHFRKMYAKQQKALADASAAAEAQNVQSMFDNVTITPPTTSSTDGARGSISDVRNMDIEKTIQFGSEDGADLVGGNISLIGEGDYAGTFGVTMETHLLGSSNILTYASWWGAGVEADVSLDLTIDVAMTADADMTFESETFRFNPGCLPPSCYQGSFLGQTISVGAMVNLEASITATIEAKAEKSFRIAGTIVSLADLDTMVTLRNGVRQMTPAVFTPPSMDAFTVTDTSPDGGTPAQGTVVMKATIQPSLAMGFQAGACEQAESCWLDLSAKLKYDIHAEADLGFNVDGLEGDADCDQQAKIKVGIVGENLDAKFVYAGIPIVGSGELSLLPSALCGEQCMEQTNVNFEGLNICA